MPVSTPVTLRPLGRKEFAQLDYAVMRHAFDCQNQLGRLCAENIYQNDLAARLEAVGIQAQREVRVTVTHREFTKSYWLDLVVADAAIYECKVHAMLVGEHEAQLLNYLFLCGANHGKLVNFRPAQVESKFINSALTPEQRREFHVETDRWQEREPSDVMFREAMLGLLRDWGGWLDLALYTEAICYFFGGADGTEGAVMLAREGVNLGRQRFHLLNPETAFKLSALTEGAEEYGKNLQSLLHLSPLRGIQWVNLARNRVQFTSLIK